MLFELTPLRNDFRKGRFRYRAEPVYAKRSGSVFAWVFLLDILKALSFTQPL